MGTDVKSSLPNMTAGRELDALVAERLWPESTVGMAAIGEAGEDVLSIWKYQGEREWVPLPVFSADIASAWQVVEKLQTQACVWDLVEDKGGWFATVHCYGPERHYGEWASTAPFSICLAALKWADSQ